MIIEPASGLTIDNLDFVVPAGPKGGLISLSHEDNFDPAKPEVMLLAGYEPGNYRLKAVEKFSGNIVAWADFEVTTLWPAEQQGPSLWVNGDFELPGIAGAAWGGGEPSEPENYNVSPVTGTRSIAVAVLLVDTSSQRFNPNDIQAIRTLWQDVTFNGSLVNGRFVSADHYYREVSYNKFNITGQVFGPVSLSGTWSDYFQEPQNGSCEPKGNFWQACATAGDPLINFQNFQYLVCVVQSVSATKATPARKVWPWAQSIVAKTSEGDIPLGMVAIHAEGAPFQLCATLVHELGHDIALGGDVYEWSGHPPQVQARQMSGWDIMAHQAGVPHPCLVHRMRMGWVPKDNIKLYNFK